MVLVEQKAGLAKSTSNRFYCMLQRRVMLTLKSPDVTRDEIGMASFGASHAVA